MTTRRQFLKTGAAATATGIVFCGCGLLHGAHAQHSIRQRLPVMIGGKRIKTIDVHAHCQFPEAGALLSASAAASKSLVDGRSRSEVAAAAFIEIDKRLAAMDAQAVDMEVLSINPFWYGAERDLAVQELETAVRKQRLTLGDAILDRLVHNAHRLQLTGESMRKQNARNQTLDAAAIA